MCNTTIISSCNDYDVQANYVDGTLASVSCIGAFAYDIVCMGEYYVEEEKNMNKDIPASMPLVSKPKIKEAVVYHTCTDDFGPTRMDKDGNPVFMTEETGIWKNEDGELFDDNPMLQIRDDFGAMGPANYDLKYVEDIASRTLPIFDGLRCSNEEFINAPKAKALNLYNYMTYNGKELRTWGLKKLNLNRKDAKWLWDNKETVLDIYRNNADDTGEDTVNECCTIEEELIENKVSLGTAEFSKDSTEMSNIECNVIGVFNEKTGHNHGVVWSAVRYGVKAATNNLERNKEHLKANDYEYLSELITTGSMDMRIKNMLPTFEHHVRVNKSNKIEHVKEWDKKHDLYMKTEWINCPNLMDHRILDIYEPTNSMKEGFILSVDYVDGKFVNKQQWRILGLDRITPFYAEKIKQAKEEGFIVHARNVRKENQKKFHKDPLYFACWNLWLKDTNEYMAHVKAIVK